MKISYNLAKSPSPPSPIALTIGNFDGVHLGHQSLLNRMKESAPYTVVLTFSNHPSEVLHQTPVTYLTTLSHRLAILEKLSIDETLLISFSKDFANQTAAEFLSRLKQHIPFTHLILGHDARIGSDRKSDLSDLAEKLEFSLEYLEPVHLNGKIISSREIRKCIQAGDLTTASYLLGRPYSIFATVEHGDGKGGALGFHTANLPVEQLTLPPFGVWAVEVKIGSNTYPAVANLGHAPTLHANRKPCLEVHLLDQNLDLYGQNLEVFFIEHIRAEKRFESIDALKTQIQNDIFHAKQIFTQTIS